MGLGVFDFRAAEHCLEDSEFRNSSVYGYFPQ